MDIKKLKKSFGYALSGVNHAINHDQNLVIHFIVSFIIIFASIFLKITPFEMGILGITMLVVIVTEMVNTSIEVMVDLITKEHREEAKIAKDVSAGMVLVTVVGSLIIGILIFLPYVIRLFR